MSRVQRLGVVCPGMEIKYACMGFVTTTWSKHRPRVLSTLSKLVQSSRTPLAIAEATGGPEAFSIEVVETALAALLHMFRLPLDTRWATRLTRMRANMRARDLATPSK